MTDSNEFPDMPADSDCTDPEADTTAAGAEEADPLNEALTAAAQWKEVALRTAAELDNYRKRMSREMQDTARFANAALLESLLPILDNFDYGMQAAKAENENSNLYIGLSMVLRQVQDFLRDQGVEEVAGAGAAFDPNVHEAVSQQASAEVPEGTILSLLRKGYKLRERLLRPASVVVSSGPQA